ncbi:hypothetical protein BC937DRAFT_88344 [Endogone sp. FLAS-F59071]|nr:hypothetical protein BC937DRAFT_88344 [Endogone sp. FLAS-F59071]|eukprot:RUS18776.1 hypothetical protein BC937DRAFT_88344 [Endogone sp. FLAS-F59071]
MLVFQIPRLKCSLRAFILLILFFFCLGALPTCAAINYDRINQYSILIGKTIWVFGGASPTTNETVSNILTGLNLSIPWNSTTPPWTDYTAIGKNIAPLNSFGGFMPRADGSVLYMWGEMLTGDTAFAMFNLTSKTWTSLPNSTVPNMSPAVWDSDGNGWTWGDFALNNRIFDNSVFAFNPNELAWTTLLQMDTALPRRTYFTLVLVCTTSGTWLNQTATGDIPDLRGQHTAVLGLDDASIIIFGGSGPQTNDTTVDPTTDNLTLGDVVYLNTTSMTWMQPSVSGNATARYGHSATLVGDLMLVMYGSIGQGSDQEFTNDVDILNITSWSWQKNFTPYIAPNISVPVHSSSKPFTNPAATHLPSSPISSPVITPHPSPLTPVNGCRAPCWHRRRLSARRGRLRWFLYNLAPIGEK